jgi:hypothetical protein
VQVGDCWKYALEPTGFDPLVGSDGLIHYGVKVLMGHKCCKAH